MAVQGEKVLGFTWNVPNALTLLRLVFVPVLVVVFLLHPQDPAGRLVATGIFVMAVLTDSLDGHIARKYNMITDFGKIWDSIADKALTGVAFVLLSVVGQLPWVITVVILIREWGITALRFAILKYGVMAANRGGKLKTLMQSFTLVSWLPWLPTEPFWFIGLKWVLLTIAFILTVLTGIDYLFEARRLRAAALAAGGPVGVAGGAARWANQTREPTTPSEDPAPAGEQRT